MQAKKREAYTMNEDYNHTIEEALDALLLASEFFDERGDDEAAYKAAMLYQHAGAEHWDTTDEPPGDVDDLIEDL